MGEVIDIQTYKSEDTVKPSPDQVSEVKLIGYKVGQNTMLIKFNRKLNPGTNSFVLEKGQ